jgi:hypothetical protein
MRRRQRSRYGNEIKVGAFITMLSNPTHAGKNPSTRFGIQVYTRKSMHVPLNPEAVRDAMPALFDLLREEDHPAVRIVSSII